MKDPVNGGLWPGLRSPLQHFGVACLISGVVLTVIGINILGLPLTEIDAWFSNMSDSARVWQSWLWQTQSPVVIGLVIVGGVILFGGEYIFSQFSADRTFWFISYVGKFFAILAVVGQSGSLVFFSNLLAAIYGVPWFLVYAVGFIVYPVLAGLGYNVMKQLERLCRDALPQEYESVVSTKDMGNPSPP